MPKLVFYFIQKEPGSDITHPECFQLQKDTDISIRDVIESFPLSRFGRYHIRFRQNVEEGYQWIDPQELDIPVPKYNGGIFLKVINLEKIERGITRIPIEESIANDLFSETEDEEIIDDMDYQFFESPGATVEESFVQENSSSPDLFAEEKPSPPKTIPTNKPTVVEEAPVEHKYVSRSDIQLDSEASKLTATSYEGKSATVVKAMKEREKQLREKQIKALMEKKEREIAAVVHEEERDKAKQKYGPILDQWSVDAGGEKKNIRTLLTTMHTVMWEGADFTPIQMSEVLLDNKVKTFYRRAMLKVHPDKNQDGTPEQKYIAQRIFDALNQAWNKFQEAEKPANPFMMYSCVRLKQYFLIKQT